MSSPTPSSPTDAYVGLGGNLGDVRERFAAAVANIRGWECVRSARLSSIYRSAPVGPVPDQPPFLNAVVHLTVAGVTADALHARLQRLERTLGRVPGVPQGPRAIDLDLIAFGQQRSDSDALTLPHPRAAERAFVLLPLRELAGDHFVLSGRPLSELLARPAVAAQDIHRWDG